MSFRLDPVIGTAGGPSGPLGSLPCNGDTLEVWPTIWARRSLDVPWLRLFLAQLSLDACKSPDIIQTNDTFFHLNEPEPFPLTWNRDLPVERSPAKITMCLQLLGKMEARRKDSFALPYSAERTLKALWA